MLQTYLLVRKGCRGTMGSRESEEAPREWWKYPSMLISFTEKGL
jgi:hypothetical protein